MNRRNQATLLGVLALTCWSTSVAFTRRLAEGHAFAWPGLAFLLSGLALIALDRVGRKQRPVPEIVRSHGVYRWVCGGAYVLYSMCYVYALSLAESRRSVLGLQLINYLWPALTLLLAATLLGYRARWRWLVPGFVLCVAGVASGLVPPDADWHDLMSGLIREPVAAVTMFGAALLWAVYSAGVRKWSAGVNELGWFQVAAGVCCLGFWALGAAPFVFDRGYVPAFLYTALAVLALAYRCWDVGMARGDLVLLGAVSNFAPIGSVAFCGWYFDETVGTRLWLAAGLVTAGALLCRSGLRETPPSGKTP